MNIIKRLKNIKISCIKLLKMTRGFVFSTGEKRDREIQSKRQTDKHLDFDSVWHFVSMHKLDQKTNRSRAVRCV